MKSLSIVYMTYSPLFLCLLCPQPTHLANFNQVQSIQYSAMEEKDRKGMLQLNVAGAAEVQRPCLSIIMFIFRNRQVNYFYTLCSKSSNEN